MSGSATRDGPESRGNGRGSRARILARVARATAIRDKLAHPGRLETPAAPNPAATFVKRFTSQGGEVAAPDPDRSPRDWLTSFLAGLGDDVTAIAIGADVPARLQPLSPGVAPAHAETGSLILPSTGARAVQLLPPVHIVWVPADRVFARLEDALLELQPGLPAGVGLHSGPSKSADIGQTVVTGVHGPGRCIAVLTQATPNSPTPRHGTSVPASRS